MAVEAIPDTSPRVIPMLVCRDPEAEIGFCERVLKAEVGVQRPGPDGHTIHAALILGEARIIIQAEFPQFASREPQKDGSSPVVIFVYVDNVDRAVEMTSTVPNIGTITPQWHIISTTGPGELQPAFSPDSRR